MFIIRTKGSEFAQSGWVVMKTPLGPLVFGFATEKLARAYVEAVGKSGKLEAVSRDDLLAKNPTALDGVERILLFPSLEVLQSCYRQGEAFRYQDYVVELSNAT